MAGVRLGRRFRDEVKEPGDQPPSGFGVEGEVEFKAEPQTPTWAKALVVLLPA